MSALMQNCTRIRHQVYNLLLKCSSICPSQDVGLLVTFALRAVLYMKDSEVPGRVSWRKWFPNAKGQTNCKLLWRRPSDSEMGLTSAGDNNCRRNQNLEPC